VALLNEITRTALEETDVVEILNRQVGQLMKLVSANGACITLWDAGAKKSTALVFQGSLSGMEKDFEILSRRVHLHIRCNGIAKIPGHPT
jgi:hypothetical protein